MPYVITQHERYRSAIYEYVITLHGHDGEIVEHVVINRTIDNKGEAQIILY